MKKSPILLVITLLAMLLTACGKQQQRINVTSPDGNICVEVWAEPNGEVFWQLSLKDSATFRRVLAPSRIGMVLSNDHFDHGMAIKKISSVSTVRDTYRLSAGKAAMVDAVGKQFSVTLLNEQQRELLVHFRVYDDGAAFQYEIPGSGRVRIARELTTFAVTPASENTAWLLPYDKPTEWGAPAYEGTFLEVPVGTHSPEASAGWSYPMLFEVGGDWLLISEAGTEAFTYGGTHLHSNADGGIYRVEFAGSDEAYAVCPDTLELTLPVRSTWKMIVAGKDKNKLIASNLMTTLNPPSPYAQTDWIKPGVAAWSWWSDFESPKDYNALIPFVDMASRLHWPYLLVDANWDLMKNGDVEQLVRYAASKNVGIFLWYNSGGKHNVVSERPRDIMNDPLARHEAMKWMRNIGIKGIKVDFFGSDKPCVMQLYSDILHDAMEYRLLVNFHGCTLPRGWNRTYPNLMTMEAVKGAEAYHYEATFPTIAPAHNTLLAFTRNVVGSMDYTPTTFTHKKYPRRTTSAHELALSVLFESGVVHVADAVGGIMATPDYVRQFFGALPVAWDEVKLLHGYPGKEIVLARRKADTWYIAGINGETKKKVIELDLSFLPEHTQLDIITDGTSDKFKLSHIVPGKHVEVELAPNGGFLLWTK